MALYINVAVVGDTGVGKKSFLEKIYSDTFNEGDTSLSSKVRQFLFCSEEHPIKDIHFSTFLYGETHALYPGIRDEHQTFFVMFDHNKPSTYESALELIRKIKEKSPGNIIVLIGTKTPDTVDDMAKTQHASEGKYSYTSISAKTGYNLKMPFLYLFREILNTTASFRGMEVGDYGYNQEFHNRKVLQNARECGKESDKRLEEISKDLEEKKELAINIAKDLDDARDLGVGTASKNHQKSKKGVLVSSIQ